MKTALLLTYLMVSLAGLSLQDDLLPDGFDATDLKSSVSAILGQETGLVSKARLAKAGMVQEIAKADHPQITWKDLEFRSDNRADFIKGMNSGRDYAPMTYLSDVFMRRLEIAASQEVWTLLTFTLYDGKPGFFGYDGYIYGWLVRFNAKTQKVDNVS